MLRFTSYVLAALLNKEMVKQQAAETALLMEHKYGIRAELILAIIKTESNFKVNARGSAGEVGLMQLHPRYHKGIKADITSNIEQGVAYLAQMKKKCAPKYGKAYFICYNVGANKNIKHPTLFAYYKKVRSNYGEAERTLNLYARRTTLPSKSSFSYAALFK